MDLKEHIRGIPDFPIPGILFYDISTILKSSQAMEFVIESLHNQIKDWKPDVIAGIESRGFLFATPLALRMNLPMVMIRKAGKLPGEVISYEYDLEYGTAELEIRKDSLTDNARVLIIDDVLATGGTAICAANLLEHVGANIAGFAFLVSLDFLGGEQKLPDYRTVTLIRYE